MELDTPYVHFRMRKNLLIGTYKDGLYINLPIARQIVSDRIAFTGGSNIALMIVSRGVAAIDKPAREYLASDEGTTGIAAAAIVVGTPFSSLLGNFFLTVYKTKFPAKAFTKPARAEQWLQQFVT